MLSKNRLTLSLAALLLSGAALAQAPDPALPGPFASGVVLEGIAVTGGDVLATDVYFPRGAAGAVEPLAIPCPVVVIGHGFARSKARHAVLGAHLAGRGHVVLVPNFAGADHSKNADDLSALLDWALAENARSGSLLFGALDPEALGCSGHSAGGLAALLCAARDPRIRAAAPMDPVDSGGLGLAEIGNLSAPVSIAWSEPSACNANASATELFAAAPAPKRGCRVVGGTHCDPEEPTDFGCELFCGGSAAMRQEQYLRQVTAWLEYHLRCDDALWGWVHGDELMAEVAAGRLTYQAEGELRPCSGAEPPGEVTGLRVRRSGDDLELSWDPAPAAPPVTGYRVRRSGSFDFAAPVLVGEPTAAVLQVLGEASDGRDSAWKVTAFGPGGEGP